MKQAAILCVDDDDCILASLGEQLQRHLEDNYVIELASSGAEALELLAELQEDKVTVPLILSDQMMPEMSGDQLLIQVHRLLPETFKILLTGEHQVEAVRNAVNQANLYRYVAKPWDETDLLLTVQEALRSYQQHYQLQEQQCYLEQANQQLAQSLATLQATLDATADGILVLDQVGSISHFNHKLLTLLGLLPDAGVIDNVWIDTEMAPKAPWEKVRHQLLPLLQRQLQENSTLWQMLHVARIAPFCQELDIATGKGSRIFECYGQPQRLDGGITGQVWSFRDITARKEAAALIQYQAHHDSLTGLANRVQFDQFLVQQLDDACWWQRHLAILFVDLDRFKLVNDTLGHPIGDALLQQVVQRLQQCSRQEDLVARWGGDEFALVLPKLQGVEDCIVVAQRILKVLQKEFQIEDHQIHISASIGMAFYPEDGNTAELLLKNADAALYEAKAKGRNRYARFTAALGCKAQKNFALETALHGILERQELLIHYQPQFDIEGDRIIQMEALARWFRPQQGWIPPEEFIPRAEQNGLILSLGEWILRQACQQAQAWRQQGMPIAVSVNLSPHQLQHPQLVSIVAQVLTQTGLSPHLLELEITESVALEYFALGCNHLLELQQMGIKIALDDFGTGYASLSHLKQLPLNTLKIDRSFILDLTAHSQDEAIIRAILALAKGLELRVVAEGVETAALAHQLQAMGCCYLQGYWLSRPLPAKDAGNLLKQTLQN